MCRDFMLSTVSDTFKILACSALFFWYMPTYLIKFSVIFIVLKHIHAHWDIIMTYSGFIQAYSAPCVALAYSWPCHIRSPSVFRTRDVLKTLWNVDQAFSQACHRELCSHIQTYSKPCATLAYAETWHTRIFRTLP